MQVEYPTNMEREMKTKKSHEIPDYEWGQTPDLQEWIDKSLAERFKQAAEMEKMSPVSEVPLFNTLKPINLNYNSQFNEAKYQVLNDIGVNGNLITASLAKGDLTIDFKDDRVLIEPHANGEVIGFHNFGYHTLVDLSSYIPTNENLLSCIFVFACDNQVFEYLILPRGAQTLGFTLLYTPHGEDHA